MCAIQDLRYQHGPSRRAWARGHGLCNVMASVIHILTSPSFGGSCLHLRPMPLGSRCSGRPYQRARRIQTTQALPWNSRCFGAKMTACASDFSEGRTSRRAVASSSVSAPAGAQYRCVPFTRCGTSSSHICPMGHAPGRLFLPASRATSSGRPWAVCRCPTLANMVRMTSAGDMPRSAAFAASVRVRMRAPLKDMRRSGCTLVQILTAGQWKSAAFLKYLNEVTRRLCVTYLRLHLSACAGRSRERHRLCGRH